MRCARCAAAAQFRGSSMRACDNCKPSEPDDALHALRKHVHTKKDGLHGGMMVGRVYMAA